MKKMFKFSLISQVVIGVFITAFLTTAVVSAATTIGTNMTTAGTLEVTGNTITLGGTTPTMTVGDAGAEDAAIVYNGNAQDFYVGLDDTADDLVFGLGSALGTTQAMSIDENLLVTMSADALLNGTTPALTMGDAGAEDTQINFDGNAVDFSFGLDDSADKLVLGLGTTLGTTQRLTFNSADLNILVGDATAADVAFIYDGNAQDFYIGLDDTADDLVFGLGSALGTTQAMSIDENLLVTMSADALLNGTTPALTMGDAGEEDTQINFDGAAQDFSFGLDDSADKLVLGLGTTLGTTERLTFNSVDLNILVGDATAADVAFIYDGNAQDFYAGLDDSADDYVIGLGSALGTTQAIGVDENVDVSIGTNTMDALILKGRLATSTAAGAALAIDSTYTYAEGMELRYAVSDFTNIPLIDAEETFKAGYLRAESTVDDASAVVMGLESYGVANAVGISEAIGVRGQGYVKGDTADTVSNVYAVQGWLSGDAGRTTATTLVEAAGINSRIVSWDVADDTKIHGFVGTFGDMDGDSATFGNGILLQDGPEAGTSILTAGLNINMAATNDIVLQNDDTITNGAAGVITFSTDIASTDGRLILGTETGGTCSTGLAIDLSAVAKGVITTIGETNTACAISFTNGTAGEVVFLSHDYTGTGVVTFADVTGFDAAWTPVGATCSGIDAGVTAANNDHFYLVGVMTSATEIMITGCQYFDAA